MAGKVDEKMNVVSNGDLFSRLCVFFFLTPKKRVFFPKNPQGPSNGGVNEPV